MSQAFIGLGSNQQQPLQQLQAAVDALQQLPQSQLQTVSSVYCGPFVGGDGDNADVFNAVALLETTLTPHALLVQMQEIEQQQGRVRNGQHSDRSIDLDLLLFDDCVLDTDDLQLPHPRLSQRAFVLYPLAEIAADLLLPDGHFVSEYAAACTDSELIKTGDDLYL